MVVGGLEAMTKRLQTLTNDYSWWEEAHDAFVRGDSEWIEDNVGTGITETEIADLFTIISPKAKSLMAGRSRTTRPRSLLPPVTIASIRGWSTTCRSAGGRDSAYIDTPNGAMLLAVSHITPVSRSAEIKAQISRFSSWRSISPVTAWAISARLS